MDELGHSDLESNFTDFHGLYGGKSELAGDLALHLLSESFEFHNSLKICVIPELFGMIDAWNVRKRGFAAVRAAWPRLDPYRPVARISFAESRHVKARERRWPQFP